MCFSFANSLLYLAATHTYTWMTFKLLVFFVSLYTVEFFFFYCDRLVRAAQIMCPDSHSWLTGMITKQKKTQTDFIGDWQVITHISWHFNSWASLHGDKSKKSIMFIDVDDCTDMWEGPQPSLYPGLAGKTYQTWLKRWKSLICKNCKSLFYNTNAPGELTVSQHDSVGLQSEGFSPS